MSNRHLTCLKVDSQSYFLQQQQKKDVFLLQSSHSQLVTILSVAEA